MKIWEIVFLLPFAFGVYFFIKTPLVIKYGAATWSDPLAGFCLILITTLYFYLTYLGAQFVPLGSGPPCTAKSRQMECYNLTEEICLSAWASSYGNCEQRLADILKVRPSFLSGSFLEMCIGRNFDKTMHYNRKNEASTSCRSYFFKIDKKD